MLKELLTKINEIESTKKEIIKEAASMNISMTGDNADEVAKLVDIIKRTNGPEAKPVDIDMINQPKVPNADIAKSLDIMTIGPKPDMDGDNDDMPGGEKDMDDLKPGMQKEPCPICGKVHLGNSGCGESTEEDYANEPDEKYQDHHYMTKDLAGGLNKPKKAYPATQDGDNPMAVEDKIKEELAARLRQMMDQD